MMKNKDLLAGAAKATTYNIALQFLVRIMTFLLNAFVLRYVSRDLLGVVNVRLTLLYSTVLFLSCEPFDKACQSRQESKDWRQVVNLIWCALPVSVLFAVILGCIWVWSLELPDPGTTPYYHVGVACFAVSSALETAAAPLLVVGKAHLFVKLKVLAFGSGQAVKCIVTVVMIYFLPTMGLLAFSLAQVMGSAVYCIVYYGYFARYVADDNFPLKSFRDFFPRRVPGKPFLDGRLSGLVASFFKQSILKQILTEGERFIMTFLGVLTFADQGVYDVINNLGSMAARFIFQPIEESGNLFFSQLLTRGVPMNQQKQDASVLCSQVLAYVLKSVTLIGLIILVFGQSYSFLALDLYGGSILSSGEGPFLLRCFCLYVLVIAINGITEGFVFATMSKEDVDRYNKKMLVFSAIFLASSWLLTKQLGSVGFILANCLNMAARIAHSMHFIVGYYRSVTHPLWEGLPTVAVLSSLVIAYVIMHVSETLFCCDKGFVGISFHIGIGGACLSGVLATIYLTENKLIAFVREHYNQRSSKEHEEKSQ